MGRFVTARLVTMMTFHSPTLTAMSPYLPTEPELDADTDGELDDTLIQELSEMTRVLMVARNEPGKDQEEAFIDDEASLPLQKYIHKLLRQQKDEVLYETLEHLRFDDRSAFLLLKEMIENASETVVIRHARGDVEVNAFVIPLFVRTTGGLSEEYDFQDGDAFTALTRSIQAEQLESDAATVVLVSHAYHLDEIDAITFSHLTQMIRDAHTAMTNKKVKATPALDRSMSGWPTSHFGVDDTAVELRFLLGFVSKSIDDPFYRVPEDEAEMEAYFIHREQRFQHWSEKVVPLLQCCMADPAKEFDVHFQYQDFFYAGKERGIAEYLMLQMMSELDHGLQQHGVSAGQTHAIVGSIETTGEAMLRINVYEKDRLLVSTEKPLVLPNSDIAADIADICDALHIMGIGSVAQAAGFDEKGNALEVQAVAEEVGR